MTGQKKKQASPKFAEGDKRKYERGGSSQRAMQVVCKKTLQGEVEQQDSRELSKSSQRSLIISKRQGQGQNKGTKWNAATNYQGKCKHKKYGPP